MHNPKQTTSMPADIWIMQSNWQSFPVRLQARTPITSIILFIGSVGYWAFPFK